MNFTRIILFIGYAFVLFSCNKQQETTEQNTDIQECPSSNTTTCMQMDCEKYDFGIIKKDSISVLQFDIGFKNTGNKPLVIHKIDASCSCLLTSYDKTPVMPSQKSKITIQIKTDGQLGYFSKVLFINYNADDGIKLIRIVGKFIE